MTLPDARRLLQAVFAVVVLGDARKHALKISRWRQTRNLVARRSHAKTRARERKRQLRNTG